jgi:hypothetical protein
MELNPDDRFEAALIEMVDVHRRKAADYEGSKPNYSFKLAGEQIAVTGGHAVELLIAVKQARLQQLLPAFWRTYAVGAADQWGAVNEPIEDTLLDRAVYAVIAMTIWGEGGYTR